MTKIKATRKKQRVHCSFCGNPTVLFDAYAVWDESTQSYELHSSYEHNQCDTCSAHKPAVWTEFEDTSQRSERWTVCFASLRIAIISGLRRITNLGRKSQ